MAVGDILKRIGGIFLGAPTPPAPPVQKPDKKNMTIDLGESVTMDFIKCPPGTFMMGSPEYEADRIDDETLHEVTLTRGFWLGKYPVTQVQWKAVMGNNPSKFYGDDQRPVEQVSWNDYEEFLNKLSSYCDGIYRLPTEAEWEYACRAGTTTAYCFGDDPALLGDYAWYDKHSNYRTHPVGQKRPNAWGLHDMHGNVSEWCQDWYGAYPNGSATDPTGAASGSYRVLRGGSWDSDPEYCRSAFRDYSGPGPLFPGYTDGAGNDLGFRVARNL